MLAIGGLSLWIGVRVKRRSAALGRIGALILITFWLDILADLWEAIAWARWLTPFYYYDPVNAAVQPEWDLTGPLALLGIATIAIVAAFIQFERADL